MKMDLVGLFGFFCNEATKQSQHKSFVLSEVVLTCMKLFLLITNAGQINNEWVLFNMSRKNRHGCFFYFLGT